METTDKTQLVWKLISYSLKWSFNEGGYRSCRSKPLSRVNIDLNSTHVQTLRLRKRPLVTGTARLLFKAPVASNIPRKKLPSPARQIIRAWWLPSRLVTRSLIFWLRVIKQKGTWPFPSVNISLILLNMKLVNQSSQSLAAMLSFIHSTPTYKMSFSSPGTLLPLWKF